MREERRRGDRPEGLRRRPVREAPLTPMAGTTGLLQTGQQPGEDSATRAFAQLMTQHHNGAISMAEDEQKKGHNADAKKMAGDIVTGQSAEVKQLQSILDRL
ncbi:DUF305 domain-containing protein [Streptomyces sp. NPDC059467]|uniref:DUF305 domain-containing protein n=1 Tax=Streptomyces sp. NPDC059467 TaxID=3346844 RepID=UPI0036CA0BB4